MKHARSGVRGEPRPKGDDRLTEGWISPGSLPPTGREILVSHLRQPAHRGEMEGPALPSIDIHDLELPGTEAFIERTVCFDGFSLEFAAFLIGGFYVDPQQAGEAFRRITGLVTMENFDALTIEAAHDWLMRRFSLKQATPGPSRRFIVSPDDLLAALYNRADAPETNLLRLMFASHRLAQHRLDQAAETLAMAKAEWNVDADEDSGSTSNSRKALYLMSVAFGLVDPARPIPTDLDQIREKLAHGHKLAREAHPAIPGMPAFSDDALRDYLRAGASELGIAAVRKPGRPPGTKSPRGKYRNSRSTETS